MNIAIFLGAVTIGLFFILSMVTGWYGPNEGQIPKVADRFLERSTEYDRKFVSDWIKTYPRDTGHYAFPVLFPLDLLFMIVLGGFLCVGSIVSADAIPRLQPFAWFLAILPAVYVATDLVEDALLARWLLDVNAVTDSSVRLVQIVTKMKIVTCGLAIGQTIFISGLAALAER